MTPQPVQIHGTPCVLKRVGNALNPYRVERRDGALIAQQPTRFLAVAKAAEVLRQGPR